MSRALTRIAAIAVVAVLALAGCSSDSDSSGETTTSATETEESVDQTTEATEALDTEVPDLCTLFTADDFEAVTGEPAGAPESEAGMGAARGSCTINAEAGFPLVMLAAYNESDREATLSMVDAEQVDDLGREAYWDGTVGLVIPLEGKDWYLQIIATDGGADLASSVQVAEIALDRLDG
ncbi:MAG: hypothetical protein KDA98_11965 [Acidimicrobiales bacterium]|nr:hypothetical protein [Acidimicrobiales bacterium]